MPDNDAYGMNRKDLGRTAASVGLTERLVRGPRAPVARRGQVGFGSDKHVVKPTAEVTGAVSGLYRGKLMLPDDLGQGTWVEHSDILIRDINNEDLELNRRYLARRYGPVEGLEGQDAGVPVFVVDDQSGEDSGDCEPNEAELPVNHAFLCTGAGPVMENWFRPITVRSVGGCLVREVGEWVVVHTTCVPCDCPCEDPCDCDPNYCDSNFWCVLSGGLVSCVEAVNAPAGTVSGPYDSQGDCEATCVNPWWCVSNGGNPTCVQAYAAPAGVLSGPHVTEGACEENCGGETVPTTCCEDPLPSSLTVTIQLLGGTGCSCMFNSYGITWNESTSMWEGTFTNVCSGNTLTIRLRCTGPSVLDWEIEVGCGGETLAWQAARNDSTCDPINIIFDEEDAFGVCCLGRIQIVVTG